MTMTEATTTAPRKPELERSSAMRLAATEYDRFLGLLRSLQPADWSKPPECPGWDVRTLTAHLLGLVELTSSIREPSRQRFALSRASAYSTANNAGWA